MYFSSKLVCSIMTSFPELTMQIMTSGGTFSFLELLLPSDDISDTTLFFLLLSRRCFSCGFGFFGVSSSKEMTKPFEASASSFSFSILIAANASASSSVRPCPERERSEEGPAESPPEPLRCCLNVEEIVGLKLQRESSTNLEVEFNFENSRTKMSY